MAYASLTRAFAACTSLPKLQFALFACLVLVAATALHSVSARAETVFLEFDKNHSHLMFSVGHLGLSQTFGEFEDFEGRVVLDTDRLGTVVVEVTVDVASLDSGLKARDDNLMGGSWFDVGDFPTMTFVSRSFAQTDENAGTLTGDLTLLGVTRPVMLEVVFRGKAGDPFSAKKTRWGFAATGAIKRSDFGMDFGLDFVSDDIELILETELLQIDDD